MANSRIARVVTEVAPPQLISVMRHRTSKMLDTINEEDKEVSVKESLSLPPKSHSLSYSSASSLDAAKQNYFLKEVRKTFSVFSN